MTAQELYTALDQLGIDYEVVEIFDGSRIIRFDVATFEEADLLVENADK